MLAAVLRPDRWWRRGAALVLTLSTVLAVVLTQSRNAMGALALAVPFVLGPMQWFWLLLCCCCWPRRCCWWCCPVFPRMAPTGDGSVPEPILDRLLERGGPTAWKHTRLGQWGYALELIAARPWLGWGQPPSACCTQFMRPSVGTAIPTISPGVGDQPGLEVMLLIIGTVLLLLVLALREVLQKAPMERAWWTATLCWW